MAKVLPSGTQQVAGKIYDLLGCYRAFSGKSLPTFWGNLSVPCSEVLAYRSYLQGFLTAEEPISCPKHRQKLLHAA